MENFKSTLSTATRTFTDKIGDIAFSGSYTCNGDGVITQCHIGAFADVTTGEGEPKLAMRKNCGSFNPIASPNVYNIPDDANALEVIPVLQEVYQKILAAVNIGIIAEGV